MSERPAPRPRIEVRADPSTLSNGSSKSRLVHGAAGRLDHCIGRLWRGGADPTVRRSGGHWWRTSRTPAGGVLVHLVDIGADVRVEAWGPGADWALDQAPRLLGCHDEADFHPEHPVLRRLVHRFPRIRVGATDLVCQSLLPTIVEQKVTAAEAFASINGLTRRLGDPAPGPDFGVGHPAQRMRLPLSAEQWARIPSWDFLRAGVEQKRSSALVGAARRGRALERTLAGEDADAALRSLPGIGAWTSARTRQQAHGDADAWSTGDYHLPGIISLALCGEVLDDDGCRELLEPFVGHRYRVELLALASGVRPDRRGPKRTLPSHLPGRRG